MRDYTPDEMARAKAALPQTVQQYLDSEGFQRAMFNIGTWHKLNLGDTDILTRLVAATIAGLETRDAFVDNLAHALPRVSQVRQSALFVEVDRWIFQKLKKLVEQGGEVSA